MSSLIYAVAIPVVVAALGACLHKHARWRRVVADVRGIALQTVIIIVVLLAIAGTVAGVLLSQSSEVTGRLQDVGDEAFYSSFDEEDCVDEGGKWDDDTGCSPP